MTRRADVSEAERLRLVLELGRHVTSILDLEVLLPEACRLIAEAFDYDLVGINLLDPLNENRLYQAAAFPTESRLPRSFRLPLGSGLTGWVARAGRPLLVNDVLADARYIAGPGREKTRGELDVPLQVGGRTLGVLNVESQRVGAFEEADIPYLEGLASQLAQAIENARLAADSRQLAAAEERARLARDLHDETIQALVALGRQLDLLALDLEQPRLASERLERIQALLRTTIEGVRRMSLNQRPAALEDLGLVAALQSHAEAWLALGLTVNFKVQGAPSRLSPAIEYAVYRVAQEALSNVARHADVADAQVTLAYTPDELVLCVADAGTGFSARRTPPGQGLLSMRDRATEVGGSLDIESAPGAPGNGTRVRFWIPLKLTLLERG